MASKKKAAQPSKPKRFSRSSLIAETTAASKKADVDVKFLNGIGQVTASLFRNGVLINMQSISTDGVIHLADVQAGDTMSVNGVCTGSAVLTINQSTYPATPEKFSKGTIMTGYLYL